MSPSMGYSTGWRRVKRLATLLLDICSPYQTTWIVKLRCGCIISESVNQRRTRTLLECLRDPTCRKLKHFTGEESGWPQIEDAGKATILRCDALSEKRAAPGRIRKALQWLPYLD